MRRDIAFNAEGVTLRGWLYLPEKALHPVPIIVMAHGFSAVKEMCLDKFAEVFSRAGLAALVFDNRCFGASDGEPRQEIDPWLQARDYRHAITYACSLPEIDRNRIGLWGSSYSGGHVIVVGAIDRRVKCIVSQVPLISGYRNSLRMMRADLIAPFRAMCDADRDARLAGGAPMMVPVVAEDPMASCALPTPDSWEWFSETGRTIAPSWRNEVTLRSLEMLMEYDPVWFIERISPTPLMMLVGSNDHLAMTDEALRAYNLAAEPKKLVLMNGGGHFDAYGRDFELASASARDWFVTHLGS